MINHGGQASTPSLLAEVERDVVFLTVLKLAVDMEVVKVDGHKLGNIRH